jgi:hypothetical protein
MVGAFRARLFAGAVKKKLGLALVTETGERRARRYRIAG